jgi:hypothetical protein
LTDVYPEFEDEVAIVAVGFGSSQTVSVMNAQKEKNGYPGLFTEGPDSMVRTFGVRTQSTKFGISTEGVIQFKKGYGTASDAVWRERLQALIDG